MRLNILAFCNSVEIKDADKKISKIKISNRGCSLWLHRLYLVNAHCRATDLR